MSRNRKEYEKHYKRDKYKDSPGATTQQLHVEQLYIEGLDFDDDSFIDDVPTMDDIRRGWLLQLLVLLSIKSAQPLLDETYW